MYLFWRRGQVDVATRLLGATEAAVVRSGRPLQRNEERLIAEARPFHRVVAFDHMGMGLSDRLGTVQAGKYADLIVLSRGRNDPGS